MRIPVLSNRTDRKQAQLTAAIEDAVGKAISPVPQGATAVSGATYPVNPSSPFSQSAGSYGANPLPRPAEDFGSLFGPGFPLWPDAIDSLGQSGRAAPRRYQYRVSENISLGQFGAPWTTLREIASQVDVVSRCIQLVQDSLGGMEWSWGFSRSIINQIRLENQEPNSAIATSIARDKYGEELTRVQKFWDRPDERMGYTFSQWLNLATWANLVYDGIVVYPSYTLGGDLHSLSLLDTSTIKILLDNQGFIPQPPAAGYQQLLYGFPRSEFQAEDIDTTGNAPNMYRQDQLSYYIQRPRLHTPYGFSTVEECINIASLYQDRQAWMHAEWSHGVTPKGVIKTTGTEGWTPEQFAYFQQNTNDQWSGQTQRRQQVMVLRPGMEWEQLKDFAELYKTDFEEWCVMQIGAKFGVPQQQLGIPMRSYARSGAQNQTSMDLADRFAINALVNHLINCINDLTRRYMGVGSEITITATSGNGDDSDYQRAQADASDVNNAIRTTNEIRAERGLPLISDKEADVLRATAGNAVIFFPGQLAYQEATEQAVLNGLIPSATPNASTPNDRQQNAPATPPVGPDDPAAPKSKSNTAETANRSVGHVTTGSDMVTPGTDRKARAAGREPNAPQPTGESGAYAEKELATFLKFAKSRNDRGSWREFEFKYISDDVAKHLNDAGARGDLETIQRLTKAKPPIAAGIAVRAADSSRILMLQRSLDPNDPAPGKFEFPGGRAEDGETPYETAVREWQEEVGTDLPDGEIVGDWLSPDGIYQGYVLEVPSEADVDINLGNDDRPIANPDDPDGDCCATVAWMDIQDIQGSGILRNEVTLTPWDLLTPPIATKSKSDAFIDYSGRVVLPKPLKPGDKVVIEHKNGKSDDLALEDVDDLVDKSKSLVPVVPDPVAEVLDMAKTIDLVVERIRPDIERLNDSYAMMYEMADLVKSKTPELHIHNEMPAAPDVHLHAKFNPQIDVDATSQHTHNVDATSVHNVDATSTHQITVEKADAPVVHVAAPAVSVEPAAVTVESPTVHVEAPNVTVRAAKAPDVHVEVHAQPQKSKIVRQDDGSIVVERED